MVEIGNEFLLNADFIGRQVSSSESNYGNPKQSSKKGDSNVSHAAKLGQAYTALTAALAFFGRRGKSVRASRSFGTGVVKVVDNRNRLSRSGEAIRMKWFSKTHFVSN